MLKIPGENPESWSYIGGHSLLSYVDNNFLTYYWSESGYPEYNNVLYMYIGEYNYGFIHQPCFQALFSTFHELSDRHALDKYI